MNRSLCVFFLAILFSVIAMPADSPGAPVSKLFDQQLAGVESEIVPLAEAMPAEKFDFAPTHGEFKGVRTFGQQASHVAAVLYAVSASVLGEKNPTDMGASENGPASLKTKAEIVKYLRDAFAYAHKAMDTLTAQNLTGTVKSPFGNNQVPRASLAVLTVSHTFDHYGQMVVYARMNGIIPPASRR